MRANRYSLVVGLAFGIAAFLVVVPARADELVYWTKLAGQQLEVADITTGINTVLENTPGGAGQPDSLIFDTQGNILYSEYGYVTGTVGAVRSFNPTTLADTLVATAPAGQVTVDLALDPGGASVLVSNQGGTQIDRVTLPGGPLTVLPTGFGGSFNGIAYDAKGDFFAVNAGARRLDRINPSTGAALASYPIGGTGYLDGITFDSVTGNLFIANGGCLEEMTTAGVDLGCKGSFSRIDGVESTDGGDILVADAGGGDIGDYNIAKGTSTVLISTPGIDDIAPVAGLGAPPPSNVPEPSSFLLLGSGLAGLAGLVRRCIMDARRCLRSFESVPFALFDSPDNKVN